MEENEGHQIHSGIWELDFYKPPDDIEDWLPCPYCKLKPKVWVFDNGRSTACGCWTNQYDRFSIHAESIMSVYSRTGKTAEHECSQLKENWNTWVQTGEHTFRPDGGFNGTW